MSASRDRKEAAKYLGIALTAHYRKLLEATGEEEITKAAIALGELFKSNLEYICWCLREYGGVDQMPFQRQKNGFSSMPPTSLTGQDIN